MMKINEYEREIMVLGFKGVKVEDVNSFVNTLKRKLSDVPFQLFDAEYVAGRPHLFFASVNALKAFKHGENISENIEMETLLYASGQRQIKRAIDMLGMRPATTKMALLVFSKDESLGEVGKRVVEAVLAERDDSVLDFDEEKIERLMKTFKIAEVELETIAKDRKNLSEAVTKAIVERMALLAT
jgi:KEOPS complex subunit Cgi121